ncbi:LOW QUALITY PROTEIN: hypothetical protein V1478_004950, partial [Vespula squamosa]
MYIQLKSNIFFMQFTSYTYIQLFSYLLIHFYVHDFVWKRQFLLYWIFLYYLTSQGGDTVFFVSLLNCPIFVEDLVLLMVLVELEPLATFLCWIPFLLPVYIRFSYNTRSFMKTKYNINVITLHAALLSFLEHKNLCFVHIMVDNPTDMLEHQSFFPFVPDIEDFAV